MKILKKTLIYILFIVPFLLICLVVLMIFPKGNFETQLKNNKVPALGYAIIKDGKISELKVSGELENGKEAPENIIFNLAYITKPVFSTMIINLVDDGLIGLHEPVYPYWIYPEIEKIKNMNYLRHEFYLVINQDFQTGAGKM